MNKRILQVSALAIIASAITFVACLGPICEHVSFIDETLFCDAYDQSPSCPVECEYISLPEPDQFIVVNVVDFFKSKCNSSDTYSYSYDIDEFDFLPVNHLETYNCTVENGCEEITC